MHIEKGPGKKEIGIEWTGGVDNPPGNTDGVTVREVWGQAADCGIQKDDQIVPINGQWTIGGRSSLWSHSRFNECSRQYSYVGNQERCAQKQVSSANRGSSILYLYFNICNSTDYTRNKLISSWVLS